MGARALWGDETYSIWASRQPWPALFGGLDTLPPLYYALLKLTLPLSGASEFAARYPSLFFGVLIGPTLALASGTWFGRNTRAVTVCMAAVSPLLVYFYQEARIYSLALFFCAVCVAITACAMQRGATARLQAVQFLAALCALFTHLYCAPIVVVLALFGQFARRGRFGWIGVNLGALALFAAWFWWAQQAKVIQGRSMSEFTSIIPAAPALWTNFLVGNAALWHGLRAQSWLMWPALISSICTVGLFAITQKIAVSVRIFCAVLLATPMLAALISSGWVPAFNPRYFVFALLSLLLMMAALWRKPLLRPVIAALWVACVLAGLPALYDATWTKTGYDLLLRHIRQSTRDGDAAVLLNSDQAWPLAYYGPTGAPTWLVPNSIEVAAGERELRQFLQGAKRVWLVSYGSYALTEKDHFVSRLLGASGQRVQRREYHDAVLSLFQLSTPEPLVLTLRDETLGGMIRLTGAAIETENYAPGEAIRIELQWQANAQITADYTVFLHLRNVVTGEQIAAFDSAPSNGSRPTGTWRTGDVVLDRRGISIPENAPPGRYRLVTGMYAYPSFQRLRRDDGSDEIVIGEIDVIR